MTTPRVDLNTVQGFFALAPFMVDLGVQAVHAEPGRVDSELALQPRFLQHTGQAHAGVMTTLADHTMGAAAQTLAPAGQWVITAELKASLLRPGLGERLVCSARVLKAGQRLSFTEAEVWGQRGDERVLVLKASATMALVAADRAG